MVEVFQKRQCNTVDDAWEYKCTLVDGHRQEHRFTEKLPEWMRGERQDPTPAITPITVAQATVTDAPS